MQELVQADRHATPKVLQSPEELDAFVRRELEQKNAELEVQVGNWLNEFYINTLFRVRVQVNIEHVR